MKKSFHYIRTLFYVLWDVAKDEIACLVVDIHNFFLKFRKKPKPIEFEDADFNYEPYEKKERMKLDFNTTVEILKRIIVNSENLHELSSALKNVDHFININQFPDSTSSERLDGLQILIDAYIKKHEKLSANELNPIA